MVNNYLAGKVDKKYLGPYAVQSTEHNGNRVLVKVGSKVKVFNVKNILPFPREGRIR